MDFVLEYALISDFCNCCRLLSKKEVYLGLVCDKGWLHMFACDHHAVVESYVNLGKILSFSVGISLDKFLAVSKRLYEGKISFKTKAKKLEVRQGNTLARFPVLREVQEPTVCTEMYSVAEDKVQWFLESLVLCNESVVKSDKFQGILVDQTGQFVRVGKFSSVAITLITCGGKLISSGEVRYVVPSDIVTTVQSLKAGVQGIRLSNNWVEFSFKSNIILRSCLLSDGFPSDYMSSLDLIDEEQVIAKNQYSRYIFDRDELFSAVDAVMLVADNKRASVEFKMLGFEAETNLLVWNVRCSAYDGSFLEESFKCSEVLEDPNLSNFNVSGFDLANSLKSREKSIYLYASDEKPVIVVSDVTGDKVTMLIKSIGRNQ